MKNITKKIALGASLIAILLMSGTIAAHAQVSNGNDDLGGSPISNGNDDMSGSPVSNGGDELAGSPTAPATPAPTAAGATVISTGGGSGSGGSYSGFVATPIVVSNGTTSCPLITTFMKAGSAINGADVTKLQAFLNDSEHISVAVTGNYDLATENAVKAFQAKYLSDTMGPWGATQPSGSVYITTQKKVNELACKSPLTLNASELSIIEAYKAHQGATIVTGGTVGTDTSGINASTTSPLIGGELDNSANTASVVNASVLGRFWNFLKSIF